MRILHPPFAAILLVCFCCSSLDVLASAAELPSAVPTVPLTPAFALPTRP